MKHYPLLPVKMSLQIAFITRAYAKKGWICNSN